MGRHSPGGARANRFPLPPSLLLALGAAAVVAVLIVITVAMASGHRGPLRVPARQLAPSPARLLTPSGSPTASATPS